MTRLLIALLPIFLLLACKNTPTAPPDGGNPDLARLNALLADNPSSDSLYYLRGRTFWQLEAFDEAINDATRAIQIDSTHPRYYHLLADALIDYGRPNDSRRAIEVMKKACVNFPNDPLTWLKMSEFYLIVKQHNEALKCLDHILQRDPQNAEAFFMTGRVALDMGDTTRASRSFQKTVTLDAQNRDAWVFLGRIFSNQQDPLAIQFYDNALRLDSTDVEVQELKAAAYKVRGKFPEAFALYRKIVREHPDYSNAFFDMGLIYLELDSLDQAYRHFDLAVKTDQLFVVAYYYRGVASEAKGDLKAAIADYKQANGMSPNLPEPREALLRLKQEPVQ